MSDSFIKFEGEEYYNLVNGLPLEETDIIGGSTPSAIGWPRIAGSELSANGWHWRKFKHAHGPVYIPPPRPEFATTDGDFMSELIEFKGEQYSCLDDGVPLRAGDLCKFWNVAACIIGEPRDGQVNVAHSGVYWRKLGPKLGPVYIPPPRTGDTIEFESRVHDRLDDHTALEEFDLVCTGSLARVIAWPRGTLPRFAYGEKVRYYRERIEAAVHGPVYIPPPRTEFATTEDCKPGADAAIREYRDTPVTYADIERVRRHVRDKMRRMRSDSGAILNEQLNTQIDEHARVITIPHNLAKAVYKELAPGMTGKPVRELLRLIDEGTNVR